MQKYKPTNLNTYFECPHHKVEFIPNLGVYILTIKIRCLFTVSAKINV